jgi:eukaryotic-like serine/threonine-protein kinase
MVMSDEVAAQRVGTTLREKWVLEALLGVGGMASVYAARHKIGRRDAIKILHPEVAASDQLRARFEQEAHAVNAFQHPGVVQIRDVDTTEDGAPFLVMELLEGESLGDRIGRSPPLDERAILELMAQTLDVLAAAHARGIIHRDIKPDNLFLSKDGPEHGPGANLKVLDFGIARIRSSDRRALTTKAGVTLGTMQYMAPEQARGELIDGRADVFAVGATFFKVLAGQSVHNPQTEVELLMKATGQQAPRLLSVKPDVAPNLALVIDRALAFDKAHRYPDAATMLGDVRAVLEGRPPPFASSAPAIPEGPPPDSLFTFGSRSEPSKAEETPAQQAATVPPPKLRAAAVGAMPLIIAPPAPKPVAMAPTMLAAEPPPVSLSNARSFAADEPSPISALPVLAPSVGPTSPFRMGRTAPPAEPTRVSDGAIPSAAIPSQSRPTRLAENAPIPAEAVRSQRAPVVETRAPTVKSRPQAFPLVIAVGIGLLALLGTMIAIVWFLLASNVDSKHEVETTTTTTTPTADPAPPPAPPPSPAPAPNKGKHGRR